MKTSEALERAHALISKPGVLTKYVFARDARGDPCGTSDDRAACFCAAGAVRRVVLNPNSYYSGQVYRKALDLLNAAAEKVTNGAADTVFQVNDMYSREELDACFRLAIAEAKFREAADA